MSDRPTGTENRIASDLDHERCRGPSPGLPARSRLVRGATMKLAEFEKAAQGLADAVAAMTLATCAGGIPWAADVYFARFGYDFVFYSSPDSRHCRNLAVNPACAVTVHAPAATWREIRGLQMEGTAAAASADETAQIVTAYFEKFPFARELMRDRADAAAVFFKARPYVFRPTRICYLDNTLRVGTRFSLALNEGRPAGSPELEEPPS
jgi:hypothetical protein